MYGASEVPARRLRHSNGNRVRHAYVSAPTSPVHSQRNRYRVRVVLGRAKNGRRQRSEGVADTEDQAAPDHELESYLAALSPEEDPETTGSGRRFGSSEVHQLRLPLMANERLKELAAQQGTSPSALARDWVLQHLNDYPEPAAEPAPEPAWPAADQPAQPSGRRARTERREDVYDPYLSQPPTSQDPYRVEETDTEITVPHNQYRYY